MSDAIGAGHFAEAFAPERGACGGGTLARPNGETAPSPKPTPEPTPYAVCLAVAHTVHAAVLALTAACASPDHAASPARTAAPDSVASSSRAVAWPAPSSQALLFAATPADEAIAVSSKEDAILDLDVRVTAHVISEASLRARAGSSDLRHASVRTFVRSQVRDALATTAAERSIGDLWGPRRAEWVAAAEARCRPVARDAGVAIERVELVEVRIAPQVEQALRRAGTTPGR